jgi:hypothetical protein
MDKRAALLARSVPTAAQRAALLVAASAAGFCTIIAATLISHDKRRIQAAVGKEETTADGHEGGDEGVKSVCMDPLGDSITTLPCTHVIHKNCMKDLR